MLELNYVRKFWDASAAAAVDRQIMDSRPTERRAETHTMLA